VIGQFAARLYPPGYLSDIGTIHFARWVTVPNTRDLLFLSNYDSSWRAISRISSPRRMTV
jgi:hypothetical protein